MTFASLGLSAPVVRAVSELGYARPTPVQTECIPAILRGGDVWACAPTGSGKTAAFVLPLIEGLSAAPPRERSAGNDVRALVLAPTRELAAQIAESFERCGRHLAAPLRTRLAVGGESINPQMMALRGGADVLVATPGRLLDLADHNAVRLGSVATLVLDEADRLFALGFADELARILERLPASRQNALFSATFPPAVHAFAERMLRAPTRVDAPAAAPRDLITRAIEVDAGRRTMLLRALLATHAWPRVLVFVASQHTADRVAAKLERAGVRVATLHGGMSQGARRDALQAFHDGRVAVLLATDLAARGLDIAEMPAVVNYDLPRSAADYTHRVGRAGHTGEAGVAISFVSASTEAHFRLIERRNHLDVMLERVAGFEPTEVAPVAAARGGADGGIKGRRKSKKDKLREAVKSGT